MDASSELLMRQFSEIHESMDSLVELYKKAVTASNTQLSDVAENAAALMAAAESSTVQAQRWLGVAAAGDVTESATFVPNEWATNELVKAEGMIVQSRFLREFVARTLAS